LPAPSLAKYVKCLERGDWPGVDALMLVSANKLAQSGADILTTRRPRLV
jgi:aspartate racemase